MSAYLMDTADPPKRMQTPSRERVTKGDMTRERLYNDHNNRQKRRQDNFKPDRKLEDDLSECSFQPKITKKSSKLV